MYVIRVSACVYYYYEREKFHCGSRWKGRRDRKKKSLMQCIDLWHTEWCVCMGFEGSSRYSSSCCRSSLMRLRHRPINYPHAQTAPYYVRTYLPMYIYNTHNIMVNNTRVLYKYRYGGCIWARPKNRFKNHFRMLFT